LADKNRIFGTSSREN